MAAYNNEQVMRQVLNGYLAQTEHLFLLTIADDGSGPQIKSLCDEYARRGLNIRHVWHEDNGYRRASIINKALAGSTADYIILTDNDCIPHKLFVEDHKQEAKIGYFSIGRRADLDREITASLLSGEISLRRLFNPYFLLISSIRKHLKRPECAIHCPGWLCQLMRKKRILALGANMAIWRKDLIAINGFDNQFQGYGFEESDLELRLERYGIKGRSIKGRAGLAHMYHPERAMNQQSISLFEKRKTMTSYWVDDGIVS